ncbi:MULTISPECIES: hypothetical protein [Metallosphaera]|uniref:VapB-type antitoxin n=3 Tax=Metallosphaera TaxID=41980 RepID=A4YF79_METS5|nr:MULTISPECIES: hypothetical protein [Metallosphaera]ABP95081.1 hypothetical protein Msed_0909 [Metallosphaera sedula DSM 5348]AIM27067.1 hypothetical protein HA72_0909 [Metallosphaera sedula]AKV73982.1 hypothetical protein MsedA_0925 [Metallosphaera sedula]AKV76221.1 hypothetical protein MsedB_0926 [Metallosphaera sedula]AKV78474.1 hypothetical protein MsedC_0925 [Metallosphaera sedula]
MTYTTIAVSEDVKSQLEKLRRRMEIERGMALSWDDFFREVFKNMIASPNLTLSENEAETLIRLTREGRRSWRRRSA